MMRWGLVPSSAKAATGGAKMINAKSRIDAFRDAQLDMLGHKDFADPFLWAGFTLYGQWGPMDLH
jgi:hypothetical protein